MDMLHVFALTPHFGGNLGDFTRGVISSARGASKSGSQMRGSDVYQIGDFTTGTASAAGNYASENRERLAGAGGSAAGMIAGAALLGPIGFVAGSFLGSSAAQSSMRALSGNQKATEDSAAPTSSTIQGNPTQGQVPDLLSPNDSGNINAPASLSGTASYAPALNTEAQMVGDVATSDHRAVMVQAQMFDPLNANSMRNSNPPVAGRYAQPRASSSTFVPAAPSYSQVHETSRRTQTTRQASQRPVANVAHQHTPGAVDYPLAAAVPVHSHPTSASISSLYEPAIHSERGFAQNTGYSTVDGTPVPHMAYGGGAAAPAARSQIRGRRNQSNSNASRASSNQTNEGNTTDQDGYRFGKFESCTFSSQGNGRLTFLFYLPQAMLLGESLQEADNLMDGMKTLGINL